MFEKRKVWVGVGSALASSLVVASASADQPASVYPYHDGCAGPNDGR